MKKLNTVVLSLLLTMVILGCSHQNTQSKYGRKYANKDYSHLDNFQAVKDQSIELRLTVISHTKPVKGKSHTYIDSGSDFDFIKLYMDGRNNKLRKVWDLIRNLVKPDDEIVDDSELLREYNHYSQVMHMHANNIIRSKNSSSNQQSADQPIGDDKAFSAIRIEVRAEYEPGKGDAKKVDPVDIKIFLTYDHLNLAGYDADIRSIVEIPLRFVDNRPIIDPEHIIEQLLRLDRSQEMLQWLDETRRKINYDPNYNYQNGTERGGKGG